LGAGAGGAADGIISGKQFAWGLSVCSLGNFIGVVVRACLIR